MTSGIFLVILVVYHLFRAFTKDNDTSAEEAYQVQLNPASPAQLNPERKLEYIVNNKQIPCAFERYYYVKLKMPLPIIRIDPEVIERHYQIRLQDKETDANTLNDVEAANRFFIDRMGYLSHLN